VALELVAEPDPLRGEEAERRVVELQLLDAWRERRRLAERERLSVRDHLLDLHGRRLPIDRDALRVDDGDPAHGPEPEPPVLRLPPGGKRAAVALACGHPVGHAIDGARHGARAAVEHVLELSPAHAVEAAIAADPEALAGV